VNLRGLKQPIPKHIYDQAKAADLARPDFYVGPTVSKKARPNEAPQSPSQKRKDLEEHMSGTSKAAREAAKELRAETKALRAVKKVEHEATKPGSATQSASIIQFLRRMTWGRLRTAR
jgi:hypothetical protein